MSEIRIRRVTGALAEVYPMQGAALYEMVRVGSRRLLGEVIRVEGDSATVQVFEETTGLALEESVERTGSALTAELGPGLLGRVIDGIGRPLERIAEAAGTFIRPGTEAATLDAERRWPFDATATVGRTVCGGDVLGTVEEVSGFAHRILVPPGVTGALASLASGSYTVHEPIGALDDGTPLTLAQRWPVRAPRPVAERLPGDRPFITGQRVMDFLFPVAEGGTVAVPGGFGTGKTVIEQSLAKFGDADVVVYVGCGERGNEMAEVLKDFGTLTDPRTGRSLMDRTILVVNTSNMPVAAREASVYLGMTVAEYFRDQGYRVAVMADSLSRWAEALREISARLQEMPGEEGYPTALGNRLGKLYERAGRARPAGTPERTGAVTFISAVSPPGGDFSEPVTQASLRVAGALWALDAGLAHQRQFPAVDWETSYTLYDRATQAWFAEHAGADWTTLRAEVLALLQQETELKEIAGLVGPEALEDVDRLLLETARLLREVVLGQNAYDPTDAFSPIAKTRALAALALAFHRGARASLEAGLSFERLDIAAPRRAMLAVRQAAPDELDAAIAQATARITPTEEAPA